jgi:hypothetical protein
VAVLDPRDRRYQIHEHHRGKGAQMQHAAATAILVAYSKIIHSPPQTPNYVDQKPLSQFEICSGGSLLISKEILWAGRTNFTPLTFYLNLVLISYRHVRCSHFSRDITNTFSVQFSSVTLPTPLTRGCGALHYVDSPEFFPNSSLVCVLRPTDEVSHPCECNMQIIYSILWPSLL